jgi:hypothetical protein
MSAPPLTPPPPAAVLSFFRKTLILISLVFLVILMYIGYTMIMDIPFFWSPVPVSSSSRFSVPDPDKSALGYCVFEGEDLQNGNLFKPDGTKVPVDVSPVKCSECNQYVYKKPDGSGCVSETFDSLENINIDDSDLADQMCDPAHPERGPDCVHPHGVCSRSTAPSQFCPF